MLHTSPMKLHLARTTNAIVHLVQMVLQGRILEPYIFNKDIDLIYDISFQQIDRTTSSSYKLDEFNTGLGFQYSLTNEIKHSLKIEYILKDYSITNSSTVSSNIEKQSGTNADVLVHPTYSLTEKNYLYIIRQFESTAEGYSGKYINFRTDEKAAAAQRMPRTFVADGVIVTPTGIKK